MPASILVAYATQYGSTQEVAEAVGARLREIVRDVDVAAARGVSSLTGIGAVVLGAPLYFGSLHRDAQAFLKRHRTVLERLPVALFVLGPITAQEDPSHAHLELEHVLAKVPWFKPAARVIFVGRYDPSLLRFPDSLLAKLPASPLRDAPPRDDREWTVINAWASTLPTVLAVEQARLEMVATEGGG